MYVRTEGSLLPDARIMLKGQFETAVNGTYAWLNNIIGVGVLKKQDNGVGIEMWMAEPGCEV